MEEECLLFTGTKEVPQHSQGKTLPLISSKFTAAVNKKLFTYSDARTAEQCSIAGHMITGHMIPGHTIIGHDGWSYDW